MTDHQHLLSGVRRPALVLAAFLVAVFLIAAIGFYSERSFEAINVQAQIGPTRSEEFGDPVKIPANGFAVSRPVRDMPAFRGPVTVPDPLVSNSNGVKPDSRLGRGELEKDSVGPTTIVPGTDSSRSNFPAAFGPNPLPTPSTSFEGISVFDTVELGQGFLPPDTTGEAGPNHFVQAVNVAFRVFSRTGAPLTPAISLGTLFSSIPGGCGGALGGFPQVKYDQLADRWLISQRCNDDARRGLVVAVSKTPDPTGEFYLYHFVSGNTKIIDSPKIAVWPDAYYMGAQQVKKIGILARGAGFFAFDRVRMLAGDPDAGVVYVDSCPENNNCLVFGPLPLDLDGLIPPPEGAPGMFTVYTANYWNDPEGDGLRFWDFHVDFENPENSTVTERPGSPLPVNAFTPGLRKVPQPLVPSGSYLETLGERLMYRAAYRNFGDGRESVIINHSIGNQDVTNGIRYYQLDRTGSGQPWTMVEQEDYWPDTTYRWMASGAMNYLGDTAIGFSASSQTVFPSIRYAARLASDPPGTGLAQGEQTIIDGGGSQFSSTRRWGTYSHMSVDPVDDCNFWYTTEYYESSNTNGWQTRIARFAPRECSISPRGVIQGTVTSCSTNQPLANVQIGASLGFAGVSGADGNYSMTVIPGTYDLGLERLGYTTAGESGVGVAEGATVTRDFCLTPISILSAGTPEVTVGNNVLEPNECNTLRIPIKNVGAIPAEGVSVVLSSSTPGVNVDPTPVGYPDIAANGGTGINSTPFKIVTDESVACFSDVALILAVTFEGASAPVEIPISIHVGRRVGENYVFTRTSGSSLEPGGEFVPGSNDFSTTRSLIPSPFPFTIYGRQVNTDDILVVERYGVIEVATSDPTPYGGNRRLPTNQFESPVAVMLPYWDDLEMRSDSITGAGIFTKLFGTAPNRTFQVEWRAKNHPGSNFGLVDTVFGIQFHENSDDFEYIYEQTGGGSAWNGTSATIGIEGNFYGSNYTEYSFNHENIFAGAKLSAQRLPPSCIAGNGQCGGLETSHVRFDFDGDGRTDPSIFRPNPSSVSIATDGSSAQWWYLRSGDLEPRGYTFGLPDDIPAVADYTGDGKSDIAFFRPSWGYYFILRSEDDTFFSFPYARNGDVPVTGDFDGDGRDDLSVFRPLDEYWYILRSSDSGLTSIPFGKAGDVPTIADFDGDGRDDIGIFRRDVAEWWQLTSSEGVKAYGFGDRNDIPVVGDWTGDGKADVAMFRPSTSEWYVIRSEDNSFYAFPWGAAGDVPAPGDFDGDGIFDPAVWRPSDGTWYILGSTSGFIAIQFGQAGDRPLPAPAGYSP